MIRNLFLLVISISLISSNTAAKGLNIRHQSELRPSDYLIKDNQRRDSSFDTLKVANLNFNIGLGSDCGRIKLDASLKAALTNIFDSKYFGNKGKDILDSSWMLVVCYLSPNWCSILRHFRLNGNFIARMRQNQCDTINKYIDSRVGEFNRARQECVSRVLSEGGNAEKMAEECGNRHIYDFNLKSWAGNGGSSSENRLLADSAKWAGFTNGQQSEIVNLAKQFVGDTIIAKGNVRVEYGPDRVYIPPKRYLIRIVQKKKKKLCDEMMARIDKSNGDIESAISQADIEELNGSGDIEYIDRQTIRFLSLLPYRKRSHYCYKISSALGNAQFNHETGQALNFLSLASQNPNLPKERQVEILRKKQLLQDDLNNIKREQEDTNSPLNTIASEISREGKKYEGLIVRREGQVSRSNITNYRTNSLFFNCVTPAMCDRGPR